MPVPIYYMVVQVLKGLRGELPIDVWSSVHNVVCNDQSLPIPPALINVMYIHNTKNNIKYIAGYYEVVV